MKPIVVVKNESHVVNLEGEVSRAMSLHFEFNPDEYEVVLTKDKSYLIREKK